MNPLARRYAVAVCSLMLFAALVCEGGAVQSGAKPEGSNINPMGFPKPQNEKTFPTYAVWHADGFWHIQAKSGSKKATQKDKTTSFTGSVRVEGGIIVKGHLPGLDSRKAKTGDWIFPVKDSTGRTTGFDFSWSTASKVDAINFSVSKEATGVTFKLLVEGSQYPKRVLIGSAAVNPKEAIFTLPAHP